MYKSFVSIMFALALGLVLLPVNTLIPLEFDQRNNAASVRNSVLAEISQQLDAIPERELAAQMQEVLQRIPGPTSTTRTPSTGHQIVVGSIMVCVILSLWWWYAIFFARVAPALSPLYYIFDFLCLTSVALAAQLWPDTLSWVGASFAAILFLLIRFSIVLCDPLQKPEHWLKKSWEEHEFAPGDHPSRSGYDWWIVFWAFVALSVCGVIAFTALIAVNSARSLTSQAEPQNEQGVIIIAFGLGVVLSIVYTGVVAFFFAKNTAGRSTGISPAPACPTSLAARGTLLPAFDSVGDMGFPLRMRNIESGLEEFDSMCAECPAGRLRSYRGSNVHCNYEVEIQAVAMSLRYDDADTILRCAQVTAFMHWFDDLIDSGPLHAAVAKWLSQEFKRSPTGGVDRLLRADWSLMLAAHRTWDTCVRGVIEGMRSVVEPSSWNQFDQGLHRLVLGAVLVRHPVGSNRSFHRWLLSMHRDAFVVIHWPDDNEKCKMREAVENASPEIIALTSKPAQECWDAVAPDSLAATALMNCLLIEPVFFHNAEAETAHGELDKSWSDIAKSEELRRFVDNLASNPPAGVNLGPTRKRQVKFIASACRGYLRSELDSRLKGLADG